MWFSHLPKAMYYTTERVPESNGIPARTNLQIEVYEITICLYSLAGGWYFSEEKNMKWLWTLYSSANFRRISPEIRTKSSGFHLKSARFHEIRTKSGGFHLKSVQNLLDFTWNPYEICQISHEICMKSAGFYLKSVRNPPDFMNVSFCVMIKYRSFFRKTNQYLLLNWDILFAYHILYTRVPTAPGKPWKPGKVSAAFPVMEISWNFKILKKSWKNEKKPGKMRISGVFNTLFFLIWQHLCQIVMLWEDFIL